MNTENLKTVPQWRKSKDEIWNEVFAGLEDSQPAAKTRRPPLRNYAAAAAVALLLLTGVSFAYLYTVTETATRGVHLTVTLPDGSDVTLNAESRLSYKPCWWHVSRDTRLTGEAFFEVKPGRRFTVTSGENRVEVLGTSFNIFSRPEGYRVTCLTGRVSVSAKRETVLLTPNRQAVLQNRRLRITADDDAGQSVGWTQDKFIFIGVPLSEAVGEIERQYDIRATTASTLNHLYTGNFSRPETPQEALEIIGKPFNITFSIGKR
jgi:ferric-dicitrate binding protein FerR (iron transport regulator)